MSKLVVPATIRKAFMTVTLLKFTLVLCFIFLSGIFLTACGKKNAGGFSMPEMTVNVVGAVAKKQPLEEKISLVGSIEANEIVEIKSELDGTIEEISFQEGMTVKKGDLLLQINKRKLDASLAEAAANLKMAESTWQRYESLSEPRAVSQQEYDQARMTLESTRAQVELMKAQLHDATITAPFDGVISERLVSPGQFITKGQSLTSIINQDPMKVVFRVPERYTSRLNEGQPIEVSIVAYSKEKFSGEVYFIDPQINEKTRTALVKAKIPNPEGKLRRGMFANLNLIVNVKEDAIGIPETALQFKGDDVSVFIVDQDSKAQIKPITIGTRLAGVVEVTSGLKEGEIVIKEGFQKIGPGTKVAVRYPEDSETVKESPTSGY